MNRILAINFMGSRRTRSVPLYQWDYGQILKFNDLELPEVYEVHFSNNEVSGNSITSIGNADGVQIPDVLLQKGSSIFVWIFLHDTESDGETEYKAEIPVIRRARPTNDQPTPVQQDTITQAIAALNNAVTRTTADVESTSASAELAEQARIAAENARAEATASALDAEQSASSAHLSEVHSGNSELNAKASELAAKQSELNAKASEEAAKESELNAAESEQNALNSAEAAEGSAVSAEESKQVSVQSSKDSQKYADRSEVYYNLSRMQAATGGFMHLVNKNGRIYCVRTANCGLEMRMVEGRLQYGYTE